MDLGGYLACTCPVGIKKLVCKHLIMIIIRYHNFDVAPAAKATALSGIKRKAGRPKKINLFYLLHGGRAQQRILLRMQKESWLKIFGR